MITSRYSVLNHLLLFLVASFIRSRPAGGRMVIMAQSFKYGKKEIRGYGDDCVNAGDFRRAPDLPSRGAPHLLLTRIWTPRPLSPWTAHLLCCLLLCPGEKVIVLRSDCFSSRLWSHLLDFVSAPSMFPPSSRWHTLKALLLTNHHILRSRSYTISLGLNGASALC